ncbi:MAG: Sb-PDE family phosphodiesterase [Bacteroidales bacterium]
MKRFIIISLLLISAVLASYSQRKIVNLPDLPGYVTLKCDFHTHTVFSDGNVWPTVRLGEAYRDGLDAIAITDHIEYQPKKDQIPTDHNAGYNLLKDVAKEYNIILVHGAEITRDMPPGHLNALFLTDANALVKDSVYDAIEAAVKQGAFIQWNHPGWKSQEPDGIPKLYNIHIRLLKNGWIHGIEFFNSSEYYPHILEWCQEYKLAVIANSDIHGIISESYHQPDYTNRPMTLVFANERTEVALKEALFAGRTLAYFRDMLAGKEELAKPYFFQCISIGKRFYETSKNYYFEITNNSDIPFYLINGPKGAPATITLNARSVTRVALSKAFNGTLTYDVRNVLTGTDKPMKVELKF